MGRRLVLAVAVLVSGAFLLSSAAVAQQGLPPGSLVISVLVEKRVLQLPDGPFFWRIENYPTLAHAQAAAGLWGLAAEFEGKVWLFRLAPRVGHQWAVVRLLKLDHSRRWSHRSISFGSTHPVAPSAAQPSYTLIQGPKGSTCLRERFACGLPNG